MTIFDQMPPVYGTLYLRAALIEPRCHVRTDEPGGVIVDLGGHVAATVMGTADEVRDLCARIVAAIPEPEPRFEFDDIPPHPQPLSGVHSGAWLAHSSDVCLCGHWRDEHRSVAHPGFEATCKAIEPNGDACGCDDFDLLRRHTPGQSLCDEMDDAGQFQQMKEER